jgi:hypothetical protein
MNSKKQVQGITTIAPEVIRKIPGWDWKYFGCQA